MRQEVLDFYAANRIPLKRMVGIGVSRKGLTRESVEAAAEAVYDEIQAGREIRPIRIAWEVYARSTPAKTRMQDVQEQLKAMSEKVDYLMLPWWKRLWRKYHAA